MSNRSLIIGCAFNASSRSVTRKFSQLLPTLLVALAILALASGANAQGTTGTGATVLQNGPTISTPTISGGTINPQILQQVYYANEFPGSDLGAQINAAFSACTSSCMVVIPAGTYTYSTTIEMTVSGESLIGAGSTSTILNYSGSTNAIDWSMDLFPTSAGTMQGFTLHGNSVARWGIHSGSLVGASYEDLAVDNFPNGGCLVLDNTSRTSVGGTGSIAAWTERTVMSRVTLGATPTSSFAGCGTGLQLLINGGANSYGYNRWTDLKLNVNAGETGIVSTGGTSTATSPNFYHSQLSFTCNVSDATSVCLKLTGDSDWFENVYNMVGESQATTMGTPACADETQGTSNLGTAISTASGSVLNGMGLVDMPDMCLANGNGATFAGSFRIQGSTIQSVQDGGKISNFLGSGSAAGVYPEVIAGKDFPWGFGILWGNTIGSPYAVIDSAADNAFFIGKLSAGSAPNTMTQLARIDTSGNVHALGVFDANGSDYAESVRVSGNRKEFEPGDVLAVDSQLDGTFTKATKPYSKSVAGIYSTKPGVLGSNHALSSSQDFPSEVPLAITGIVPCKVTTENGTIARGDLLVSSSRSGYAMKGTKKSRMTGAVIGKALEPLNGKEGLIKVLITLR